MGNNSSKAYNEVNSFLSASMQMTSEESQNCTQQTQQHQDINITGVSGDVNLGYSAIPGKSCEIDWSQTSTLSTSCIANQANQGSISAELTDRISQAASSLTSSLTASVGNSANATNITNSAMRLAVNMANVMQQSCNGQVLQEQGINISDVKTVNICNMKWEQIAANSLSCTQKATNVQQARAELESTIQNSSKATLEGALQFLVDIFNSWGILLLIPVIFVLYGFKSALGSLGSGGYLNVIAIIIMGLLCLYFLVAFAVTYFRGDGGKSLLPYQSVTRIRITIRDSDGNLTEGPEADAKEREVVKKNWIAFGVGFGTSFLILVGLILWRKYNQPKSVAPLDGYTRVKESATTKTSDEQE